MLVHIPTHVIAGPLGAGKTSLIRALLAQKPPDERWAVLVNEFGQVGLDAALLEGANDGVTIAEIAGGCICCVNGAPLQVGLGRLLRQSRPDRLLIEPSGLGHPLQLCRQLRQPPWDRVLSVQPLLTVLDAKALAHGEPLPDAQRETLAEAALCVLNKADGLDAPARRQLLATLGNTPTLFVEFGRLDFAHLPGADCRAEPGQAGNLPHGPAPLPALWPQPDRPICQVHSQDGGWSIGWRWHPNQRIDRVALVRWLNTLPWRRAKMVLHDTDGWFSANALDRAPLEFRPSEWRKDSRLELIFAAAQDADGLSAAVQLLHRGD